MSKTNKIKEAKDIDFTDRTQLRGLIPRGYCQKIAVNAGVSPKVVSEYFAYKSDNIDVETAVLQVIAELKKKRKTLIKKIAAYA